MLRRPKSAVLLSLPYNFNCKREAISIKHSVKKSLLGFEDEESVDSITDSRPQIRNYIDNGPSLLNFSVNHSPGVLSKRTHCSLNNSRVVSATVRPTKKHRENYSGIQQYKRLKPCHSVNVESLQKVQKYIRNFDTQENQVIENLFGSESKQRKVFKLQNFQMSVSRKSKQSKENQEFPRKFHFGHQKQKKHLEGTQRKVFEMDKPYKNNVLQPSFSKKVSKLMRKGRQAINKR